MPAAPQQPVKPPIAVAGRRKPGRGYLKNTGRFGEEQSWPIAARVENPTLEEIARQCRAEMITLADWLRRAVDRELARRKADDKKV